jgi:phosphotransferase system enzyme I (PtsI)
MTTRLTGISASPGIAVGPALVFDRRRILVAPSSIEEAEREGERGRLDAALLESRRLVAEARDAMPEDMLADHRLVLEAHVLMHGDELLVGGARRAIDEGATAAFALRKTGDAIAARLRTAQAPYLRERARDVEQVVDHVLGVLLGRRSQVPRMGKRSILVAHDLSPAEMAQIDPDETMAIVTEHGSATSHTAILARALRIPAVVGATGATAAIATGARLIVDALHGEVIVEPAEADSKRATTRARRYKTFTRRLRERPAGPAATRCGTRVELAANLELAREVEEAVLAGADGVGLFRTEFLYLGKEPPTEEEQVVVYRDMAQKLDGKDVSLRTFDLGADKLPPGFALPRGPNPALGLRGVRLSLSRPDLFDAQLRAILRASASNRVSVMFPMIGTVSELVKAKEALESARRALASAGIEAGTPRIGAVIELPSAVVSIESILEHVDYVSVGTNDLAQYTFGLDRQDPAVAHLRYSLEPAMFAMLRTVSRAAMQAGKPAAICGDLAAHPLAVPILVGLGYRGLSIPPTDIPFVRELLSRVDVADCEDVAARAASASSATEVEGIVTKRLGARLGDLWRERGLD